jgi:ABC-2 type transport system ATP-binding protein
MRKEKNKIIKVNKLKKKFGNITAVDQISFDIDKSEIFGFLGPNGAGKTTTIRMLMGLLTPDSGSIFIDGINLRENLIQAKMKIGVIPEMGNVYVDLTAKQNVLLSGKFYGIPQAELNKKADTLLDKFDLYGKRDNSVKTFSKGMKQRVNIASALVHDPKILFLDEPTSGLDVQSQRLIKNIIKERNHKGTTIFLTTHNIEEANILCERVGIINKGKIAAINTPERLKETFKEIQSVEVSFNKRINTDLIKGSELISRIEKLGTKWKLYTNEPDKLVKYLTKFAQEHNLVFSSIEICKASLEDAFVKLTEDKDYAH